MGMSKSDENVTRKFVSESCEGLLHIYYVHISNWFHNIFGHQSADDGHLNHIFHSKHTQTPKILFHYFE